MLNHSNFPLALWHHPFVLFISSFSSAHGMTLFLPSSNKQAKTLLSPPATALSPYSLYSSQFIFPTSPSVKTPRKGCQSLCLNFLCHFSLLTIIRHLPHPQLPNGTFKNYLKELPMTSMMLYPNSQFLPYLTYIQHLTQSILPSSLTHLSVHLPKPHNLIFFLSHHFSFSISLFDISSLFFFFGSITFYGHRT